MISPLVQPPSGPISTVRTCGDPVVHRMVPLRRPEIHRTLGAKKSIGHLAQQDVAAEHGGFASRPLAPPSVVFAHCRAERSSSHRTTLRSDHRRAIRSMPISVSFCTIHSGLSCLGTTTPTSSSSRSAWSVDTRSLGSQTPIVKFAQNPRAAAIADRNGFAIAEPQHAQ